MSQLRRALGLFLCMRLTLTYLRHNPPQELLAELYCVWQATVFPRHRRLHSSDLTWLIVGWLGCLGAGCCWDCGGCVGWGAH